ncbi:MAG: ATP-binding protein [Saccharofermentans sp.]|nr:ATP-binding protein [Saccharofermentans sp.]
MRRMFMLVFIALASAAILAGIAFGIAGRQISFNYQVEESYSQALKVSEVLSGNNNLSLINVYNYVLYPSSLDSRSYIIVDSDGNLVLPGNFNNENDENKNRCLNFIKNKLNDEESWESSMAFSDSTSSFNKILMIKIPFQKDGTQYYAIQYSVVNENNDLINEYLNILFLSTMASALAMMVPTVISVDVITEPLQDVNNVAREYGRGNLNVRADENSIGEAGELAASFNTMADKLSKSINDLTNERNKLENIFNVISEGIIVFDENESITFVNELMKSFFSKVPSKNTFVERLQIIPFEEFWNDLTICINEHESKKSTIENVNFAYEYDIVPRFDADDKELCIGAIGFFRDITEEHKLDMTRRDYVANISHELRTPLQTLRGLIEPLADGMVRKDEDRMRYYDIILNETLRLSRLIDDMLELSKLQSGTITMQMYPFDMNKIVDSIYARFTPIMRESGIYFTINNNTGMLPTVNGNPDRVNQILVILLDNAKKYTPNGGSITLSTEYDENTGKIYISVADTGQGIHEYDIAHIFERFFKADRARGKKGTGLGLAIAKELLNYMGEEISVRSEYGKGTTFTFTLTKAEAVSKWV